MHDELNTPLGLGSDRPTPAFKGGAATSAVVAALVALAVVFGEAAFLRGGPSWTAGAGAPSLRESSVAPVEPPPLRLTQSLEAPTKPAEAADPAAEPAPPSRVKPSHGLVGAAKPLIIDVQQALAALRAKDSAAAP